MVKIKKNIAVVGCGYWGKNLVRNYAEIGALGAVCDPNNDVANFFANEYDVPHFNFSEVLTNKDIDAVNFINYYAPEHYMICVEKKQFYIDGLKNAGSVFIGNFSPETLGDYASGTNHTLPTSGFARQYSGVNLDSFLKSITFQKISKDGIKNIGPHVELLAAAEGLGAHKMSVSLRLKEIQND